MLEHHGLAAPRRAEDHGGLGGFDVEAHAVEDGLRAETLVDVDQAEDGGGGGGGHRESGRGRLAGIRYDGGVSEPNKPEAPKGSPTLTRTTIHVGAKFDLEQVSFRASNGTQVVREVVRHPGAVVILPLLEEGGEDRIVLIRNFRLSIGDCLWEIPAGTRAKGEDPRDCAARELVEETGYEAATVEPFGWYHLSPGMTDEKMYVFLARGLRPVGQRTEVDEFITVHSTPVDEVMRMISDGEIVDAKTIATVLRWHWRDRSGVEHS